MKESGRSCVRAGLVAGAGPLVGMAPPVSTLTFIVETTLACRDHGGVQKLRWSADRSRAQNNAAAPTLRWRAETTVYAQWCRHASVVWTSQGRPTAGRQVNGASQSKG